MKRLQEFWSDEGGIELSEYAVMLALIVIALFAAILYLSGAISGRFSHTASMLENPNPITPT